jgi:tetratricopeptide (TPR) repeat protein
VVKKIAVLVAILGTGGACVTIAPLPPSLYIENPTASFTAALPLDARIAVEDAWRYLKQGRPDKAQKNILGLGETSPFFYAGLGYVSLLQNDFGAAEGYLQKAAQDFPDLAVAHLGLGQLYRKIGRDDSAYNAFLEVLKRDPENAYARREADNIAALLTDTYLAEGRSAAATGANENATEAFLKVLHYSPRLEEAHLALARLFRKEKNIPSALFHLRTASANNPKSQAVLLEYAQTLEEAKSLGPSMEAYERLLALDPQNKAVRERLEALKVKLGVVELPSQFAEIPALEAVAKEDVAALIAVKFREVVDDNPPRPPILVDITTSWASRYIVKVAALDIMEVYSNHTFEPRHPVTRGEMADTLARLISVLRKRGVKIVAQIPPERIQISDVPPEHLNFRAIVEAVSTQVMDLGADRTFRPDQTVTGPEAVGIFDLLLSLIR